jgi:hypothetical protein
VVAVSTGCEGSCGEVVAVEGKADVAASVSKANRSYCQHFREDGCLYAETLCARVTPRCIAHACRIIIDHVR